MLLVRCAFLNSLSPQSQVAQTMHVWARVYVVFVRTSCLAFFFLECGAVRTSQGLVVRPPALPK